MRTSKSQGPFRVKAISGTRVILLAFDLDQSAAAGLRGFAVKAGVAGSAAPPQWQKGLKYFKSLVTTPQKGAMYSLRDHPVQGYVWSIYVDPGTEYAITVSALSGTIGALTEQYSVQFNLASEKEFDQGHGVWFNYGVLASHALAESFQNAIISDATFNLVDAQGKVTEPEVKFLSRGLEEACMDYLNGTNPGEGLRVCAYEFTYPPVLDALKRAQTRGVDVQIVYHDTKKANDPNVKAIQKAGLTKMHGGKQVLFPRTRTSIPHNKFIVKLVGGVAREVWTGSTNFTASGFFGQTNVGHLVEHPGVAGKYFDYWKELSPDPVHSVALSNAVQLTPNPPNAIPATSMAEVFSPRVADNMLDWYGQRIDDAAHLVAMTIPFNVAPTILAALGKKEDSVRVVILEDPPEKAVTKAEIQNKGKLAFTNGTILGKTFVKYKTAAGGAKVFPIPHTNLDQWFLDEEFARPVNKGHVFFMHAKVLLIDPLSDDPLVCSGSANFSTNSLVANDENMLIIRGSRRVADIYLTEFDRIFRAFYAREAINDFAKKGDKKNPLELDETGAWVTPNYKAGTYKNNRRLAFFPTGTEPAAWPAKAAADPDPFADEAQRAAAMKAKKKKKKPS
jgi:phosphatidylserine/phosphatidylglycerophosphate/cardiolipin synthase-like enzyme